MLSAIKKYYAYWVWTGQRNDNPCQTLTIRPEQHHIQTQDLFTSSELEMLLERENRYANLRDRNQVLLSLVIYQGLTSNELIRLNIDDIDLDMTTVHVPGSGKFNRRTLELRPTQVRLFERYIKDTRPKRKGVTTTKLILNKLGKPITVEGIFSVIEPLDALFPDRKLNPRTIRMSVIANWLNSRRLPLETVQEMAGQKWPSSTEKYVRQDDGEQRKLINQYFPI